MKFKTQKEELAYLRKFKTAIDKTATVTPQNAALSAPIQTQKAVTIQTHNGRQYDYSNPIFKAAMAAECSSRQNGV